MLSDEPEPIPRGTWVTVLYFIEKLRNLKAQYVGEDATFINLRLPLGDVLRLNKSTIQKIEPIRGADELAAKKEQRGRQT